MMQQMEQCDSLDDVAVRLGEWLREAERQGYKTPFHCALVARNGALMFNRYDEDGEGALNSEVLAQHGTEFVFPIHIMLTDSIGKCTHIGMDRQTQ